MAAIFVSLFDKNTRMTPKRLLEALAAGGQGTITVAAACGIAGVIAGTITMTGLANMLINGITPAGEISEEAKNEVQTLLRRSFRPEFLNRLDEIVFYKPLSKENITGIIDLQIAALNKRLADKQLTCELTPAAKTFVIDAAYDPQFGARPLRRYLQHTVETLLAQRILRGDVLPGQTLVCDVQNAELVITAK